MQSAAGQYYRISTMSIPMLDNNFTFLGEGISRRVYAIGDGNVIKIAKNMDGEYQNAVEVYVYRYASYRLKRRLCPVLWHGRKGLVMPRAVPLQESYPFETIDLDLIAADENFVRDVWKLGRQFDLLREDLVAASSWGYLWGQPVLIDYGCTEELHEEYYYG